MKDVAIRDLIENFVDAYNDHDPGRVKTLHTIDVVLYIAPTKERFSGLEPLVSRFMAFIELSSDTHIKVRDVYIGDDSAVVEYTLTGTHTGRFMGIEPTFREIDIDSCFILKIRDNKIAQHTTYLDSATILWALDLIIISAGGEAA